MRVSGFQARQFKVSAYARKLRRTSKVQSLKLNPQKGVRGGKFKVSSFAQKLRRTSKV